MGGEGTYPERGPGIAVESAKTIVQMVPAPPIDPPDLDAKKEQAIARFLQYSRGERRTAIAYLERFAWDVDAAMTSFWRQEILLL